MKTPYDIKEDLSSRAAIARAEKAEREFDALMGFVRPGTFPTPWKRSWRGHDHQTGEVKTRVLTPDERRELGL